jgi:hypothetical protein
MRWPCKVFLCLLRVPPTCGHQRKVRGLIEDDQNRGHDKNYEFPCCGYGAGCDYAHPIDTYIETDLRATITTLKRCP